MAGRPAPHRREAQLQNDVSDGESSGQTRSRRGQATSKLPTLCNTLKLSDSRRHGRLCSGTTPFFRRLSRASCSGRSDLPLSAVAVGPKAAAVYASSCAAASLGNGACLRRQAGSALVTGGLASLRRGRPTGARSQEEGGPSARRAAAAAAANSPGKKISFPASSSSQTNKKKKQTTNAARCGQLLERVTSTNNQGLGSFPSAPPPFLTHYPAGGNCVASILVDMRPGKYFFLLTREQLSHPKSQITTASDLLKL